MKKVKLFNDKFSLNLEEIRGLKFLDYAETGIEVQSNSRQIQGSDGLLLGPSNFGPFNLVMNFSFKGYDKKDLRLLKGKLRSILFRKEPYYLWHSDAPGKKYAVYCESNENNDLTNSFATFKITFVVYKGYSESLKETDEYSLSDGTWQFENGLLTDDDISYKHSTKQFEIYNGSSDVIDPILRHKLKIIINIEAPSGFKLINKTTGDVFEYFRPLKYNETLTIEGVHPFINGSRVGINTNFEWIKLTTGYNKIEITGSNIVKVSTEWVFPFIYR